jgi:hypothetical protein
VFCELSAQTVVPVLERAFFTAQTMLESAFFKLFCELSALTVGLESMLFELFCELSALTVGLESMLFELFCELSPLTVVLGSEFFEVFLNRLMQTGQFSIFFTVFLEL